MTLTNKAGGPHQGQPILTTGQPLDKAEAALILIHGRGAGAADILTLVPHLNAGDLACLAPQAAQHTWYPLSFLAPLNKNEPNLSSALETVGSVLSLISEAGIPTEKVILGGFSQGACLTSEFAARNPQRYGGLLIFSGGVIGPPDTPRDYPGSLEGTPVFIGCSDVDVHIPVERVHETATTLQEMGAIVKERIYPGMDHTIIQDEIEQACKIVDGVLGRN